MSHDCTEDADDTPLVCVLCGAPWEPSVKNRCACGGFCTWGHAHGGTPLSWTVTAHGWIPNPPPGRETDQAPGGRRDA
jgi:hypothetical protein